MTARPVRRVCVRPGRGARPARRPWSLSRPGPRRPGPPTPVRRGTGPARATAGLLPRGTLPVGAGLAVLGAASYVYLAVAGHLLPAAGYSSVSVLWAIAFSLGLGLFFPIEQETTRLVAARRVAARRVAAAGLDAGRGSAPDAGRGARPVFARAAVTAGALLAACAAVAIAAAPVLADRLFNGDRAMVTALVASFAGLAVAHPVRGVLAGAGRFASYGIHLGVDGVLRVGLAGVVAAAGWRSPAAFGLIMFVAPVCATAAVLAPTRAALAAGDTRATTVAGTGTGDAVRWPSFLAGLAPLTAATLLAQVVVNISVIDVKLLAPADVALAGALLSALVLARIPLFAFASMQAALLPGLSAAATAGRRVEFRRQVGRACAVVAALGLAGGTLSVLLGPWLVRVLFDAPAVLSVADFALLAAGTVAYLLAQVLGQAILALRRHRDQALAWLAGTLALVVVTALPAAPQARVELAYLVGSVVAAGLLAIMVVRWAGGRDRPRADPGF